ncbi:MAG TPA: hypothetical protein VEM13_09640 [Gemmatimonadales bacterium]|nr:hypothetical protein [Gemmatimonadales bacterium]
MEPERRLALLLGGVALALAAAGAFWFTRFASQVGRDPALVYRDSGTLDKLLKRASDAERAGDRGAAITAYRFVEAVGQGGGPDVAPYVTAARAGLRRLGVSDTPPGPPR